MPGGGLLEALDAERPRKLLLVMVLMLVFEGGRVRSGELLLDVVA